MATIWCKRGKCRVLAEKSKLIYGEIVNLDPLEFKLSLSYPFNSQLMFKQGDHHLI